MQRSKRIIGGIVFCACVYVALMVLDPSWKRTRLEIAYMFHPRTKNQFSPMPLVLRHSLVGAPTVDIFPSTTLPNASDALSKPPFVTLHSASEQKLIANLELNETPHQFYFGDEAADIGDRHYVLRFYGPRQAALTFSYNLDARTLHSSDKLWAGNLPLTQACQDYLNSIIKRN